MFLKINRVWLISRVVLSADTTAVVRNVYVSSEAKDIVV